MVIRGVLESMIPYGWRQEVWQASNFPGVGVNIFFVIDDAAWMVDLMEVFGFDCLANPLLGAGFCMSNGFPSLQTWELGIFLTDHSLRVS